MPPKAKFTRTQIVDAALDIVRECGIEGLTARELFVSDIYRVFGYGGGLRRNRKSGEGCIRPIY